MPRETIEPHPRDKRYVRRGKKGKFSKEIDVGRSLFQRIAVRKLNNSQKRGRRPRRSKTVIELPFSRFYFFDCVASLSFSSCPSGAP